MSMLEKKFYVNLHSLLWKHSIRWVHLAQTQPYYEKLSEFFKKCSFAKADEKLLTKD